MILSRRRTLVAAGATLALPPMARNSAAQDLRPVPPTAAAPGRDAPDIHFRLPEGDPDHPIERTLADYAGKPVVLNFWATWCVPCVAEMPALDRLAAALQGQAAILALSSDRGGQRAVERFYRERSITHLVIALDPQGAAARAAGSRGIPTTLLIDAAGRERGRIEGGADWSSDAAITMIRALA